MEAARIPSVLVATKPLFRDRDKEEIRGYRDAPAWLHERSADIPVSEESLKRLHVMARGEIWDAADDHVKATSSTLCPPAAIAPSRLFSA